MTDKKSFPFLIGDKTISVTINGKPNYVFKYLENGDIDPKFSKIKSLLKERNFEEIEEVISPRKRIVKYSNDYFILDEDNNIFMKDDLSTKMPKSIVERLKVFVNEDLPIEPLVNFWKNLRRNPSESSKDSLYRFLEHNNCSLTEEGNFIAYKAVNVDKNDQTSIDILNKFIQTGNISNEEKRSLSLVDKRTGLMNNSFNEIVSMPRNEVVEDPSITCTSGLHVAAFRYAKEEYVGDIVIEVIVNPKDVVSVPQDYNSEKMRVCEYKVIDILDIKTQEKIQQNKIEQLVEIENDVEYENEKISINGNEIDFTSKTESEIYAFLEECIEDGELDSEFNFSYSGRQDVLDNIKVFLEDRGYKVIY